MLLDDLQRELSWRGFEAVEIFLVDGTSFQALIDGAVTVNEERKFALFDITTNKERYLGAEDIVSIGELPYR